MGKVEPLDSLLAADDLVVPMTPAKTKQIVGNSLRKQAEFVAIGIDAERAVPLGKLCAVGTMDQRYVSVDRLGPAHGADDRQLPERIVEMVVATDHVRHAHVVIVDDYGQHVGRRSVGP